MHRIPPLILLVLVGCAMSALGHELWLGPADGGLVLLRGHEHAGQDHGLPPAPCPAEELVVATLIDTDGRIDRLDRETGFPAPWPTTALLVVRLSSGCWTRTPTGTVHAPRNEAVSPLLSWLSRESIKHLAAWRAEFAEPLGEGLEITPLGDPFTLGIGDKLRVRVTLDGRPLDGAVVAYGGRARGTTDESGCINIRLKQAGRQSLATSWTLDEATDRYDEIVATAQLQFELE